MSILNTLAKLITDHWDLLAAVVAILGASGLGGVLYVSWQNRRKARRLR